MTNLIILMVIASVMSAFMYFVNDYIHLKSANKAYKKTIEVLEHRRMVLDSASVEVEKQQNENYVRQNKALLEMDKKGYIDTGSGGSNGWLLYAAPGSDSAQDTKLSSG